MNEPATIEAAGGVVLRDGSGDVEVLMVHRPRYDDWSFPKGKLDPNEDAATAALREITEETGVAARLGPELPSRHYPIGDAMKRVRWFAMTPIAGDPTDRPADEEVDVARWVPIPDAARLLTYGADRRLLADAVETVER